MTCECDHHFLHQVEVLGSAVYIGSAVSSTAVMKHIAQYNTVNMMYIYEVIMTLAALDEE